MPSARTIGLTAAVFPNVRGPVALDDPEVRLSQYRKSLEFWSVVCEERGWGLAVVETTGAAPELLLRGLSSRSVNYLSMTPSEDSRGRGKGAAEVEALSALARGLNVDRGHRLTKVTGRLQVLNVRRVLDGESPDPSHVTARRTLDRSYVDTRLVSGPMWWWLESVTKLSLEIDDLNGRYFEHALGKALCQDEYRGVLSVDRFCERPIFLGQSGSTGRKYGERSRALRLVSSVVESQLHRVATRKQV